jgi:hypothetical protein
MKGRASGRVVKEQKASRGVNLQREMDKEKNARNRSARRARSATRKKEQGWECKSARNARGNMQLGKWVIWWALRKKNR